MREIEGVRRSTATRFSLLVLRAFSDARSSIDDDTSAAMTVAPNRRATATAVVATPQPTSSTRSPGPICACADSASVDARPPGWITRLPTVAMNLYGSSRSTSAAASFVNVPPNQGGYSKDSLNIGPARIKIKSMFE
jgi:hypothetical protein